MICIALKMQPFERSGDRYLCDATKHKNTFNYHADIHGDSLLHNINPLLQNPDF